jgi:hypothetical protein
MFFLKNTIAHLLRNICSQKIQAVYVVGLVVRFLALTDVLEKTEVDLTADSAKAFSQ